jgi:hypothetical protein
MAREVQDLPGNLRDREGDHAIVNGVRVLAGVDNLGPCPDEPTRRQLDGDAKR